MDEIHKPSPYMEFAQELYDTGIISDPWIEGKERFRIEPVIISQTTFNRLYSATELIGMVYEELCQVINSKPEFIDSYFNLTPYEKLLWFSSKGRWHGIARMDLFIEKDGRIRFCEMNSDTPSGEAEAVLLNQLIQPKYPDTVDPNTSFADKFVSMIESSYKLSGGSKDKPTVGIIYPTEMPEDLSMIIIYRKWIESRGFEVALGSPFNIIRDSGGDVYLFDKKIDVMFRHYKTDWWCERFSAWSDGGEYPDDEPLDIQLKHVLSAEMDNKLTVINPFGAVVTQNKLSMSFLWQYMDLFSKKSQEIIKEYIPETYRLKDIPKETLSQEDWVLKSDYGCEGDEVVVGRFVTEAIWKESLEKAIPERWIVQKYFDAVPVDNMIPNYGVYLIGGEAAGIYTRLSAKGTDYTAVTVPTFIVKE